MRGYKFIKERGVFYYFKKSEKYALIDDPRWKAIENQQLFKFQKEHGKISKPEYTKNLLKIII